MGRLSEEIQSILREAREGPPENASDANQEKATHRSLDWDDIDWSKLGDLPCLGEDAGPDCWKLQEAAQFVAEDIAEATGLDPEVLSAALVEAMSCDSDCRKKYITGKGDFKGGKGKAFDSCVEYAKECCTGVKDPSAFCGYIGRRAGKI